MGFFRGRVSGITRLRIYGDVSLPQFDEQIMEMAFRNFFPENEIRSTGAVNINDCLDYDLTPEKTLLGNYRVFSFRIDKRVIPPSSLKIRMLEETKKIIQEACHE